MNKIAAHIFFCIKRRISSQQDICYHFHPNLYTFKIGMSCTISKHGFPLDYIHDTPHVLSRVVNLNDLVNQFSVKDTQAFLEVRERRRTCKFFIKRKLHWNLQH